MLLTLEERYVAFNGNEISSIDLIVSIFARVPPSTISGMSGSPAATSDGHLDIPPENGVLGGHG